MGFFEGIGSFFKRQAKTKTGIFGISILAATVAPHLGAVGEMIPEATSAVLSGEPILQTILAGGMMFLRDGAARRGE